MEAGTKVPGISNREGKGAFECWLEFTPQLNEKHHNESKLLGAKYKKGTSFRLWLYVLT